MIDVEVEENKSGHVDGLVGWVTESLVVGRSQSEIILIELGGLNRSKYPHRRGLLSRRSIITTRGSRDTRTEKLNCFKWL